MTYKQRMKATEENFDYRPMFLVLFPPYYLRHFVAAHPLLEQLHGCNWAIKRVQHGEGIHSNEIPHHPSLIFFSSL